MLLQPNCNVNSTRCYTIISTQCTKLFSLPAINRHLHRIGLMAAIDTLNPGIRSQPRGSVQGLVHSLRLQRIRANDEGAAIQNKPRVKSTRLSFRPRLMQAARNVRPQTVYAEERHALSLFHHVPAFHLYAAESDKVLQQPEYAYTRSGTIPVCNGLARTRPCHGPRRSSAGTHVYQTGFAPKGCFAAEPGGSTSWRFNVLRPDLLE